MSQSSKHQSMVEPATGGQQPLVSVLMPVYNAAVYLRQAVQSVLDQTWTQLELIAVDDGSKDRSLEILQGFAQRDGRVRVISRPNTGIVGALNDGLAACSGEFIARMDSDDVARPARFEQQVRYLQHNPQCVAVGGRVLLIDPDGLAIGERGDLRTHEQIDTFHLQGQGSGITHPAAMFRAKAMRDAGGYTDAHPYAEDLDLFLRLAESGQLANLPEVVLDYRLHGESIGHRLTNTQAQSCRAAANDARRRRNLPSLGSTAAEDTAPPTLYHARWAWWALQAGHLPTARKHAWANWRQQPWSLGAWRLMYCAMRGH